LRTLETMKIARLAADIGGTFTDIVLEHGAATAPEYETFKLLTTHKAPELAILDGARHVLGRAGVTFRELKAFVHGTTLATNAIIERKGARVALIATEGFRDVLDIADEGRFDQYDLNLVKPTPLVGRALRFTVPERMDVHGKVRRALDTEAAKRLADDLAKMPVDAVAVSLIHAYANPAHEEALARLLKERAPHLAVTLSSAVCPEAREYERTSTAVANAYVQPLMAGYLGRLQTAFREEGFAKPVYLMTSGGSLTSLETAAAFPIRLVESGPAGGAILASRLSAERGLDSVLSFDMGGTTAKLCLIDQARPLTARAFEVDRRQRFKKGSGLPIRIPVIEMVEIGAGGGSIAQVDRLGRITVGPESAGSEPGPVAYGRGGTEPTVTDADVALGKIDPARFAGGTVKLDVEAAGAAIVRAIAGPMKLDRAGATRGISEIVDENMANAARVHAVERGAAVARRTMIAFGGAAPLHASRLAEKLGIETVIVPANAGVGSAIGFLWAPAAFELVRSSYARLDTLDAGIANALLDEMLREARGHAGRAADGRALEESRAAFMRYAGQGHEIKIALPVRALTADDGTSLRANFERAYRELFGRHIPGAAIEVMSWVVVVSTRVELPPRLGVAGRNAAAPEVLGARTVLDTGLNAPVEAAVYARESLKPGVEVPGPALIVEDGTTTYVSPRFVVSVDLGGALVLQRST
jgi:N-methylhydantoinase A